MAPRRGQGLHGPESRPDSPPLQHGPPALGLDPELTLAGSRAGRPSGRKASHPRASFPPAWTYPPAKAQRALGHSPEHLPASVHPGSAHTCLTAQLQLLAYSGHRLQGLHLGKLLSEMLVHLQPGTHKAHAGHPPTSPEARLSQGAPA